ncbi:hypothetical protein D5F01_LYC08926 [Larimichthys crocea]|uniref:Uncharacterized protein n=1 Tax=Larimichthys crocea TaxID=215358 RepID=A0A6G0IJF9_LARCR|nr:hypothetical protein D5F01_LYC08926 [Larimichthys crocea]
MPSGLLHLTGPGGEPVSVARQTPATPDAPLQPDPDAPATGGAAPRRLHPGNTPCPPATGIADWTVASLKRSLTHHNIPFHYSDRKATLFRRLRHFLHNSTSRTPLPGRHDDDVTPPSSARPSHPALTQGQVVSNRTLPVPASHSSSTVPQASLFSRAHASHHPIIPPSSFNPSLSIPPSTATAAPPAPIQTAAASTATHGGTSSQTPFFHPAPPFPPPFPYPYPPPPHNPHVASISVPTLNAPLLSTAPPPAGSCSLPLYPPLPSNHSLATATPPARPTASPRPSPVSSALRQQILSGSYVNLAQLIHPSTYNPHIPRELQTALGTFQLKQPLTTHSKELTAPEFTLAFSLYRDVICSAFPDRRSELDDYLSLIIDLACGSAATVSIRTTFCSHPKPPSASIN